MAAGYTTRRPLPYLVEVGTETVLDCPVYLDGALVTPVDGTISIYDEDGEAVVDAAPIVVASSVATYTLAAALTSARAPSGGWRVEWALEIAGELDVVRWREEGYLVRRRLRPVISDLDVAARMPVLDTRSAGRLTVAASYQVAIEEADIQVQSRLLEMGRRPWLVVSPSALRETWLTLTIATILDGLAVAASGDDAYIERAEEWRRRYEAAFARARTAFDWADDGTADTGRVGPKGGVVWL